MTHLHIRGSSPVVCAVVAVVELPLHITNELQRRNVGIHSMAGFRVYKFQVLWHKNVGGRRISCPTWAPQKYVVIMPFQYSPKALMIPWNCSCTAPVSKYMHPFAENQPQTA